MRRPSGAAISIEEAIRLVGLVMDMMLNDDEVQTLRGLLQDYLPELKFEVARTHGTDLRHVLVKRQTLCERLLDQLASSGAAKS
jgi:hypothetical protein